jgi:hypothetical protein
MTPISTSNAFHAIYGLVKTQFPGFKTLLVSTCHVQMSNPDPARSEIIYSISTTTSPIHPALTISTHLLLTVTNKPMSLHDSTFCKKHLEA